MPLPECAQSMREAVAWILIFLLVMLLMALVGSLLKRLLSLAGLGLADRLLGMVFGLARAASCGWPLPCWWASHHGDMLRCG